MPMAALAGAAGGNMPMAALAGTGAAVLMGTGAAIITGIRAAVRTGMRAAIRATVRMDHSRSQADDAVEDGVATVSGAPSSAHERLLTLFNRLVGGDDNHWIILPFEIADPALSGTVRVQIHTATRAVEHVTVVVEHSAADSARWAIVVRGLRQPPVRITLYADDSPMLRHLDSLQHRLTERLHALDVRQVEVRRWDQRFDGFGGAEDAPSAVRGVNIRV